MNKFRVIISFLITTVLFMGCSKEEEKIENNTNSAIPVEVLKVTKSTLQNEIELVGTLAAWKEANLGAQTTARIEKIYVEEGNRVKEGDLLFEMDDTQLAQAQIQMQVTKDNYLRLKPLYESGSISQSQFDQVKAAYETAEKSYDLLLANTQFKAPFAGVITAKKLNEGEVFLLAPGGAGAPTIVSLMQINPLKLLANISEANFRDVKLNQSVTVKSDLYPEESFKGNISRINPTINSSSRTFEIEIKIPNNGEKLRPGMFVRAKIFIGNVEGLMIPRSAALKQLGTSSYYGFIVNNNTAKRVDLRIGREFNSQVEVISGIKAEDVIITRGQSLLKDGKNIEIKEKID